MSVSHLETTSGSHLNIATSGAFPSAASQRAGSTWLWFAGEAGRQVQGSTEPVSLLGMESRVSWWPRIIAPILVNTSESRGELLKVLMPAFYPQRLCCDWPGVWPVRD